MAKDAKEAAERRRLEQQQRQQQADQAQLQQNAQTSQAVAQQQQQEVATLNLAIEAEVRLRALEQRLTSSVVRSVATCHTHTQRRRFPQTDTCNLDHHTQVRAFEQRRTQQRAWLAAQVQETLHRISVRGFLK